jgi:rubrerythrin
MPQTSVEAKPARSRPTAEGAYTEFMSRTYAMEFEVTERYAAFADHLDASGNGECALLFRQLAEVEDRLAKRILVQMGWTSLPAPPAMFAADGGKAPGTASLDSLRQLPRPHHAVELALRREVLALKYFEGIAAGGAPERVRLAAAQMARERAHARMIQNWLARVPRPEAVGARETIGL